MSKILCYGSLNTDIVYSMPHFVRPGETLAALGVARYPGGKGLNQSVALSRAGARVFHGGKIAADGEWLLGCLRDAGVDTSLVSAAGASTGTAVIQVTADGENSIIINHGANYEISSDEIDRTLNCFGSGDLLVMQNEINDTARIIGKAAARGMLAALNPSPIDDALLGMDLSGVTYLILNEIEGQSFTGCAAAEDILPALAAKYPHLRIVLTLGSEGAVYYEAGKTFRQAAYKVRSVDTTAAGDTFTGYFLAAVMDGSDPQQALELAARAAAIAVTRKGAAASIPALGEVLAAKFDTD